MIGLKASEVIEVARFYKNWQEKRKIGTRTQMWDFHWAAGTLNYTIWAMLYKDYTGLNFQGQAWCAMYGTDVVALAYAKRYPEKTTAQIAAMVKDFYGGDMPYNCQQFVNNHKNDKRMDHTPKVGASVIFWTGSKYGHWGTVTGVDSDGKGYTSVEGNTSGGADKVDPDGGAVVEKWHSLDSKTYFYYPDYESEDTLNDKELTTYPIKAVGKDKLKVTDTLNIRNYPSIGTIVGSYNAGDKITPIEKTFVNGKAWYHTDRGWISASYLEGWVQEECGNWWYMHKGYTFTAGAWEEIDKIWYYMDDTGYIRQSEWVEWGDAWYYLDENGYMVTNTYVKSIDSNRYYWCDKTGRWYENKPEYTTTKPDRSCRVIE